MAEKLVMVGVLPEVIVLDPGEYFLLIALIALIIGVIVIHIAHLRFP